jgi:hypothetical protein
VWLGGGAGGAGVLVGASSISSLCVLVVDRLVSGRSSPDGPPHTHTLAGNLLRGGDTRGYNSLAKMYTIDYATPAPTPAAARS